MFREFTIGGVTFLAQASAVEPHDASTGALMVIDYAHHEIHAGSSFAYNDVVTLGSGTSAGKLAATVHDTDERMLKRDTKYILRITSAAASNDVSVRFDWYEHTDKE